MTLSSLEAERFFRLWHELMYFVDQQTGGKQELTRELEGMRERPISVLHPLRHALWERPAFIEELLASDPPLSGDDKEALAAWQAHHVQGRFVALKHLKKHTVVLPLGSDSVAYGIVAPTTPLEFILPMAPPVLFDTVLLPFAGRIVTDGFYAPANVYFGGGYRSSFKEALRNIDESVGLTLSLPTDDATLRPRIGEGNVRLLKAFKTNLAGQGLSEKVIAQNLETAQTLAATLIMEPIPRALLQLDLKTAQEFLETHPKAATELKRFARFLYDTDRGDGERVAELQELRRRA
jgi:hypothetical protein